ETLAGKASSDGAASSIPCTNDQGQSVSAHTCLRGFRLKRERQ
ncbi:MAG: hypothetical protein ACI9OO_000447, partial [Bacteroidia bacterium]